ncbi:MAG: hypothetical protein ABMA25_04045 [Ilumatobacteraceae bacterium]
MMAPAVGRRRQPGRLLMVAAVSFGWLTSCDSGSKGDSTTTVFIEHATNPNTIVVRIGDYRPSGPEQAVLGPTLVVYGDGTLYLETPRTQTQLPAFFTGVLPEASLQLLLRAAAEYEMTPRQTDIPADAVSTILVVGDLRWSRFVGIDDSDPAFDELLQLVRTTAQAAATTPWVPQRWIVRNEQGDCTVADAPAVSDFDDAPIYPHALDTYPLGRTMSCA